MVGEWRMLTVDRARLTMDFSLLTVDLIRLTEDLSALTVDFSVLTGYSVWLTTDPTGLTAGLFRVTVNFYHLGGLCGLLAGPWREWALVRSRRGRIGFAHGLRPGIVRAHV